MLLQVLCALMAPTFASAAAHPWALPAPTLAIPEIDGWSPAPTAAPKLGRFGLFPRVEGDTVCGFVGGISTSSLTCGSGKSSICATNTYYGVHGCCDPSDMSNCDIATTCVPSSLMSASCSDAKCSSNALVMKCTASEAPECAVWNFVYSSPRSTSFIEYGCAAKQITANVERTYSGFTSSSKSSTSTRTTTSSTTSSSASPSATTLPLEQAPPKSNNTGAIVGGTIGGLVVIGAVASFIIYLLIRDRRLKREAAAQQGVPDTTTNNYNNANTPGGFTDYSPHGFTPVQAWEADDNKAWGGSPTTVVMGSPVMTDCGGHGNGQATLFGVAEAPGQQIHEAPA